MERYREIEAIRRPGSPQLEVTKVRGSWRDYLDPVEYSDLDVDSQLAEDFDLGEQDYYDYEYDDDELIVESGEFEPFSDTCGEYENDGDETDTDMEGLDLALFEPAGEEDRRRCRRCCCSCFHKLEGDSGFLMMLSDHPGNYKWYCLHLPNFTSCVNWLVPRNAFKAKSKSFPCLHIRLNNLFHASALWL